MGAKTQELAAGVQAMRLGETYHLPLQRLAKVPSHSRTWCSVAAGPMLSPSDHRWHQPLGKRGTAKPRPLSLLPLLSLLHPRDPLLGTWLKKLPGVPRRTFWDNWVTYLPSCPFCLGEADRIMDLSLHVNLGVGNFELKVNSVLTKGDSCYPSLRVNQ